MRGLLAGWLSVAALLCGSVSAGETAHDLGLLSTPVEDSPPSGGSTVRLVSNAPAYNWYHGCGPTAAATIVGYYDMLGYSSLFNASGWDQIRLTGNVKDHISSPAHNAKYDPTPDNPSLPTPPNTSLACWFQTSVDPQQYGWSSLSCSDDAFIGYITSKGYECSSWYQSYGPTRFTWQKLVNEIDSGRPMLFLVDTDGNGSTDHFIPVIGYDARADGGYYACYTTWSEDEDVSWYKFRAMGSAWGVGYATYVTISARGGDANRDGAIDVGDLGILAGNWESAGMSWEQGDFNGDGVVDAGDLGILAGNWNLPPGESSGGGINNAPEPAGAMLLTVGFFTLFRRTGSKRAAAERSPH